ncbi:MAG: glycosyltransferase family 4 protein [Jatrophihabitans sp.]
MKLLVDAVGCGHGGISTYVSNLLLGWTDEFPNDDIVVLRGRADPLLDNPRIRSETLSGFGPELLSRPIAQTNALRRLQNRFDAVLSVHPATSLLRLNVPHAVVVHDLRHELRPDQFSRSRRAIRKLSYGRGYALAGGFVCISDRTQGDLHRLHPRHAGKPATVVHHGADHVLAWPRAPIEPFVIGFGHHSNKNVDLVLQAWQTLCADEAPRYRLNIVGLSEAARSATLGLARSLGVDESVVLSPYLDDEDFHVLMAGCAAVLFPSDFEGFGLPVLEAMRLGKPVVVGPDAALREVAQEHATTIENFTVSALAHGIRAALAQPPGALREAHEYATAFTWARTARRTRKFLVTLE